MDNIEKSIVYLRGLIDGCGYEEDTSEGKVFCAIADVLDTMVQEMNVISTRGKYCEDMIDEILDDEFDEFELDDEFDEDDFVEIECPNCHDVVFFDNQTYNENDDLICPNCSEHIE